MFFNFCTEKKVVDRILSDLFVKKKVYHASYYE